MPEPERPKGAELQPVVGRNRYAVAGRSSELRTVRSVIHALEWPKGYRMTRNDSSSSDDVALMASISPDPGHYRSIANPRHSYGSTNEAEPPI